MIVFMDKANTPQPICKHLYNAMSAGYTEEERQAAVSRFLLPSFFEACG